MNKAHASIDTAYLQQTLLEMLAIPSPAGFTDEIVHYTVGHLQELDIPFELTRRGTIRATLRGAGDGHARAVVNHLDTLGAMVREIRPNGRLALAPVGTWSSRFAEGGRVSVFSEGQVYRGTVLPVLASGHAFNDEVDRLPVAWTNVELRVDEAVFSADDVRDLGIAVGDFVSFDPQPEFLDNGFINARHLDNKAGAATLLAALKCLRNQGAELPITCHPIFTVTEEVGSGSAAAVPPEVSEFVSIDVGPVAAGQTAAETGVTVCMQDASGPYDYHLTRHLLGLCREEGIEARRDVFRYYHSDASSAVAAGHDIRTALLAFGTDATHGYERTHMDSLLSLAELLVAYLQSTPTFRADRGDHVEPEDFSHQLDHSDLPVGGTPLPDAAEIFSRE